MKFLRSFLWITAIFLQCLSTKVLASHIRAGEITAKRIGSDFLTYRFTVVLYRDSEGVPGKEGAFNFGDGSAAIDVFPKSLGFINNGSTEVLEYITTHTFPSAGKYKVSYFERNRNFNVRNMFQSGETPFYIESEFLINPILGNNSSPVLLIPPIDIGATNQKFEHNMGAFDADGDSLSYRFSTPKREKDLSVLGYTSLLNANWTKRREDGSTPGTFTINPITGLITWDSPDIPGEYNIAVYVDEWRDGVLIGSVNRDMQIVIRDFRPSPNKRPTVVATSSFCVIAGQVVSETIEVTDPDSDRVRLSGLGELFDSEAHPNTADLTSLNLQPPNGRERFRFTWNTLCEDVRKSPYYAIFKGQDSPRNRSEALTDFDEIEIRVIGPAPENLTAAYDKAGSTEATPMVNLSWDSYTCTKAEKIFIYRREGSNGYVPDKCETGIRSEAGYKEITKLDVNNTSFSDQVPQRGKTYCYRIYATFPKKGESIPSQEVCVFIPDNTPYLIEVSVGTTDVNTGTISIAWTPPLDIDQAAYPPPYTYQLSRSDQLEGAYQIIGGTFGENDRSFVDTNLNTQDKTYYYKVGVLSNGSLIDTSQPASSVRISAKPLAGRISLQWSAKVPWTNQSNDFPQHTIYRSIDGSDFEKLAEVNVIQDGLEYLDKEETPGVRLSSQKQYCYRVLTQGTYNRKEIQEPLLNWSQEVCSKPEEVLPCQAINVKVSSCDPSEEPTDDGKNCESKTFSTDLSWELSINDDCNPDVKSYDIYYTDRDDGVPQKVAQTNKTTFKRDNLKSIAGCYSIVSLDAEGKVSAASDASCTDSCPYYALPNVFTPEDDSSPNNTYRPLHCPRFIGEVKMSILNRWGEPVFEGEGNSAFSWSGKKTNGSFVDGGIYYYQVELKTKRLKPEDEVEIQKGWLSVLRKKQ